MAEPPEVKLAEERVHRWLGQKSRHFAAWQWETLIFLSLINLLNYFDRLVIIPMFPYLKVEFGVSDFKLGLLVSVFILIHSLSALPFGYWSDRGPRQKIMAGGVFFWSGATLLSGLAFSFKALLSARALVGIGEGAYAPAGTAMISETFPREFRARVQSIFNLGMLVGGTLGLAAGGILAERIGWRRSFFLVGVPGFVLALLIYRLRTPAAFPAEEKPAAWGILKIPPYNALLAGGAFAAFAASSFITWGAEFGIRYYGLSVAEAATWLGGLVLAGSASGVVFGGYVADRLQERWPWGRALTIAATLLLATPFLFFAITTDARNVMFGCIFAASFFMTCYHGPATAVIHDLTPVRAHSFAFALYLFVIHLLGDTIAPALVGRVSDVSELQDGLLIGVAANLLAGLSFVLVTWLIRRRALRGCQLSRTSLGALNTGIRRGLP
jgi:predicted MFS family arabinose efflux permease